MVRVKPSGNTHFVAWSCCRCDFPRNGSQVEPRQVPPVCVAGLRATARLVEPLQHRTRSPFSPTRLQLQQQPKQVLNPLTSH